MHVDPEIWLQLALALGLGLLVGLEREQSGHELGIRTFTLITLLGASSALLTTRIGYWIVPAALVALAGLLIVLRRLPHEDKPEQRHGATTMISAFVMFVVGALTVLDYAAVAVALGGITGVLLHWKKPLHQFVERIGPKANRAVFRFVLIALVVLPVLPDQTYGPYDVFNPFRIWLVVSLIVGISVAGYIVYKFLGAKVGLVVGGILGGIVSSTAATVAYARRSDRLPDASAAAAAAIIIASTISFVRIVVEVMVVAPEIRGAVLPQFGVMIGLMSLLSVGAYFTVEHIEDDEDSQPDDPAALKVAVIFGALYAIILVVVAAAEQNFGDSGLYLVALISGFTDVDAITLSTAEMVKTGRIGVNTGWKMMMIGALSNMLFKGGAAIMLGARKIIKHILILFGATIIGGIAVIVFWPPV